MVGSIIPAGAPGHGDIIRPDGTAPRGGGTLNRRTLSLFFAAVVLLYLSALGTIPLLEPDEARYAEIPREMIALGEDSSGEMRPNDNPCP